MKVSKKKVFLLVILVVLIAVGFTYKWLDANRLSSPGGATYTGLHPFKLDLNRLRITTFDGGFDGIFTNTINETVTITKLNLSDYMCSYPGRRSIYDKIKYWFVCRSKRYCVDNYKLIVDAVDFEELPVKVGANKEFTLDFIDCVFLKDNKVGDSAYVHLSIDYQIGNKTFSTDGMIGTYYE